MRKKKEEYGWCLPYSGYGRQFFSSFSIFFLSQFPFLSWHCTSEKKFRQFKNDPFSLSLSLFFSPRCRVPRKLKVLWFLHRPLSSSLFCSAAPGRRKKMPADKGILSSPLFFLPPRPSCPSLLTQIHPTLSCIPEVGRAEEKKKSKGVSISSQVAHSTM